MARFEPVIEVVESLCLRSGDIHMANKGLYLDCANDVWDDLNETTLRITERIKMPMRRMFHVNKRTNTVDLPCRANLVSSVSIVDHHGIMYPVFRNDNLNNDFVDLGAVKNCACEFECGNQLCNAIKGYEVVRHTETDKNPDGTDVTFECIDKKAVSGGFLYEQKQYPERIYVSGVWTSTILKTENTKLCAVEVDRNGCVCDTPQNIDRVCNVCGISNNNNSQCCIGGSSLVPPNPNCDTWTYYCSSRMEWFNVQCGSFPFGHIRGNNIYNIDSTGTRLVFPPNFGWSSVLVRFYEDISLDDLMIPYIAKPTFMVGMQCFSTMHNEKKIPVSQVFCNKYSRMKWGLFQDLNKYTLDESRMMLTPPVYVPSYISRDSDYYGY